MDYSSALAGSFVLVFCLVFLTLLYDSPPPVRPTLPQSDWAGFNALFQAPPTRQADTRTSNEFIRQFLRGGTCNWPVYIDDFRSPSGEDVALYLAYYQREQPCTYRRRAIVELGASDGARSSISNFFERVLDWRAILIESQVDKFVALQSTRPNSIKINAVISRSNISAVPNVSTATLAKIIHDIPVSEIEIIVVDAAGAELETIRTMDWSVPVRFWVVEQQKRQMMLQVNHNDYQLRMLLIEKGYRVADWDMSTFCGTMTGRCTSKVLYTRADAPEDAQPLQYYF
jgi:hypothetical protein